MYYEVMQEMRECFFFTWFLSLATWLIGLVVSAYYVNCVRVEVYELREAIKNEKEDARRSLNRLLARRQGR
jgi:hypothetical protein